ncbi:uncharacterized protein LOC133471475 [Phyllopteryx taeniolatus]|uniref:uncharacterized protein LOC133471475 n=1 Tax=Phyllopteryx taeniolatus TaxID=161469 RepID=UPI002AD4F616|nr:uncharacterized protein LOC133471475 [Phyllopteryx taeniolatus]
MWSTLRVLVFQLFSLLLFGQHARAFGPYFAARSPKTYRAPAGLQASLQSEGSTAHLKPKYLGSVSQQNRMPARPGTEGRLASSGGLVDPSSPGSAPIYRLDLEQRHQPNPINSKMPQNHREGTIVSSHGIQMVAAPKSPLVLMPRRYEKPQVLPRYNPKLPQRYEPKPPQELHGYEKLPHDLRRPRYELQLSQRYDQPHQVHPRYDPKLQQVLTSRRYEPKPPQALQRYDKLPQVPTASRYEKLPRALPRYDLRPQQNLMPPRYEPKLSAVQRPSSHKTKLSQSGFQTNLRGFLSWQ